MKFGKQLRLGIYEPWAQYYIAYARLKRIIMRKQITEREKKDKTFSGDKKKEDLKKKHKEKKKDDSDSDEDMATETSRLVPKSNSFISQEGQQALDDAYLGEFFPILELELSKINKFYVGKVAEIKLSLDLISVKRANWAQNHHTGNKPSDISQIRDMYIEVKALVSFQNLNRIGFVKIVKKYDKTMKEDNLKVWIPRLANEPFVCSTEADNLLSSITMLVSREMLVEWERVAKEAIGRSQDEIMPAIHYKSLVGCIALCTLVYFIPTPLNKADPIAGRCLALLVLVVSMWITKAIPYFATGLLIPVLVTLMGVLKNTNGIGAMPTDQAAQFVMDHMTFHTTFLLLGGYTISSAFARCELELFIASWLQSKLGKSPRLFILAVMYLGLFLSMWISNHTAPILCSSILVPIISDVPDNSRFTKGLLLGLAFACNFGGMMTPISSLQNALATSQLQENGFDVSFSHWLLVSVPFCSLCVFLSWVVILIFVQPDDVEFIPTVVFQQRGPTFSKKNITVIVLCSCIILLFATSQLTVEYFGDIGIISLIFIVVMYGSGILTDVDFNSLSWNTLFLMGGGNVLGKAISSSNLLSYLCSHILFALPMNNPWVALIMILLFCLSIATFISHTVAALILMPLISQIGIELEIPKTVVMGSAFAISAAMALPFSSFPNVNSLLILDDFQKPYLSTMDFALSGGILSVLSIFLIATVGYYLIENII